MAADPSDYHVCRPSGFCWPSDRVNWHFKMGIVLSEHCTVYIQATSLLQKLWDRVSQVSEHMWKNLSILIGKIRPAFSAIYFVNCGQMSFIVRLLSRFMALEIHRTLHNFLPCLTFMLFRTCNKTKLPVYANYGYLSSVENDSEAADTAIHIKYLSNWETEQNTAHYLVFLTKCIQLSLKFHIF